MAIAPVELTPATGTDILVDIEAVGICHADVAANDGHFPVAFPTVLGHEGVGIVRAVGPEVSHLAPGQRVVLSYNSCGDCAKCIAGVRTQCARYLEYNFPCHEQPQSGITSAGTEIHGGFFGQSSFSTIARASERNAIRVDTTLPASVLAPLGCGIQTGVGAVLNVSKPQPEHAVVVVGLGAVGLAAALAVRTQDVRTLIAVDISDERLRLAVSLGISDVVNGTDPDWPAVVRAKAGGTIDIAIECTGNPSVIGPLLDCLTPGGMAVIVGAPPFGTEVPIDLAAVVNKSLTIRGTAEGDSRCQELIPHLVRLVESGDLPVGELVTEFDFDDLEHALQELKRGSVVKPVLVMPATDGTPSPTTAADRVRRTPPPSPSGTNPEEVSLGSEEPGSNE